MSIESVVPTYSYQPLLALDQYAQYITLWREWKNFPMPAFDDTERMLGKVGLITEEVGECMSAIRHGDFDNFAEELGDIIIRVCDIANAQGISLEPIIGAKMQKNEGRPPLHGKRA